MHDETFARLWREFCAHCLPVDARSASMGSTPRDADVVPATEGSTFPVVRGVRETAPRTGQARSTGDRRATTKAVEALTGIDSKEAA